MVLDPEITITKQMEIPEAFIRMRSDDIVHVYYKENVTLDVELQDRMELMFQEITGNIKTGFIFQSGEGVILTDEARENAIKLEKNSPVKASAVIISNLASRIIANFFIKMNKPKIPHKLFGTVEEAAKWLKSL
jgi:hypothetical protein